MTRINTETDRSERQRALRRPGTALGGTLLAAALLACLATGARALGPNVVTNTNDSGAGSLRDAITFANANPGTTIQFAIPPPGLNVPRTISLSSALPAITGNGTVIDGASETAFAGNFYSGGPEIQIARSSAPAGSVGLQLKTANCVVRSLFVGGFNIGIRMSGTESTDNRVEGCYVGVNPGIQVGQNNATGVQCDGTGEFNTIGGSTAAQRNIISNNTVGVKITNSFSNVIKGNYIGTDPTGTQAVPNTTNGVVLTSGAQLNTIGGSLAGEGNLISGNTNAGILISAAGTANNVVKGNKIGTEVTGASSLGNGSGGVEISAGANHTTIGGSLAAESNLISGNGFEGIYIHGTGSNNNVIKGNKIGTNLAGTAAVSNNSAVNISSGAQSNVVGGPNAGDRNLLYGNLYAGVYIYGTNSKFNKILGNYIGTNKAGTAPIENKEWGVNLSTDGNTVGGPNAGEGNLVSGNHYGNILLTGTDAFNNVVQGNLVGTVAGGGSALSINPPGIDLFAAHDNLIGGDGPGEGNVVSGNPVGVLFEGSALNNTVQGNFIGTNKAGTAAVPNGEGVTFKDGASDNLVGGSTAGARNLISGNILAVRSEDASTGGNQLFGNWIGLNAAGNAALPNTDAILLEGPSAGTQVGGTAAGQGNVISGNKGPAVKINASSANFVQRNRIGLAATGTAAIPNNGPGVYLLNGANGNTVGADTQIHANIIAYNQGDGILVELNAGESNSTGNVFSHNSIYSNTGLGINLRDSSAEAVSTPTPDDAGGDPDTGPNGLQNFPTLSSVTSTTSNTSISGFLGAKPSTDYVVEFFSSPTPDGSGFGEGQTFVATKIVTTDAVGDATFFFVVAGNTSGLWITATATMANAPDGTSEFSPAVQSSGSAQAAPAGVGAVRIAAGEAQPPRLWKPHYRKPRRGLRV